MDDGPARRGGAVEEQRRSDLRLTDLSLTQVTESAWRVCDGRVPPGDRSRLLAFVEEHADCFEVMQLGDGFEWSRFDSMAAALSFIADTGPRKAEERLRGDLRWLR